MNDDHHAGVLLEDIDDKFERLIEGMSVLLEGNQEIRKTVVRIPVIEDDIKAINAAVTDQSREMHRVDHVGVASGALVHPGSESTLPRAPPGTRRFWHKDYWVLPKHGEPATNSTLLS